MFDNNYDEPHSGCTMMPVDQSTSMCNSGVMGLEENAQQRVSARLPNFSLGEVTQNNFSDEAGIGSDLQQQLNFEFEQEYHNQMIQEVLHQQNNLVQLDVCPGQQQSSTSAATASSWEASFHEMQEISFFHQQQNLLRDQSHHISPFPNNVTNHTNVAYNPPPELLNLLQIPKCSAGSATITFGHKKPLEIFPTLNSEIVDPNSRLYDPHLSFAAQSPSLRDMIQTLNPHGYQLNPPKSYLGLDDKEVALQDSEAGRQFTNSILDLKRDMSLSKGEGRGTNHFATERQRREYLNEKYQNLRTLVPNPTKADRASIVGDGIEYIKELLRTVEEMRTLVEEKRCASGRRKRHRINHDLETSSQAPPSQCEQDKKILTNGSLRSSWLQRTSKDGTHVDVRIVDNEVNIKLIQRKRRNCLLCVSLILQELHLELLHANGANIGEHYIFMFNTKVQIQNSKIFEGSCEYARSIATKLMDAVDRHLTYIPSF